MIEKVLTETFWVGHFDKTVLTYLKKLEFIERVIFVSCCP